MHWQYSPYTLPLLLSGAISTALALYAWLRRTTPGAKALAVLIGAVAEWSFGAALQHAGADLPTKVFWNKVQYLGILTTVVAWPCVALQYTGRGHWLTLRNLVLLALVPAATTIAVWTNERHYLFWLESRTDTSAGFAILVNRHGPLFWLHTSYCYLLLSAGSVVLLLGLARAPMVYRGQARALLIAVFVPWSANVAYLMGFRPFPHQDLTPFAFILSGASITWALLRFGLLDLVPVAREAVIEGMSDGLIVLDRHERVLEVNPAARKVLALAAVDCVGHPAREVLEGWPERMAETELHSGQGDEMRSHEVRVSPLVDPQGRLSGRLVVLRDITERKRAEEVLRQRNEHLAALLESGRVITSGLDLPTVLQNIAAESARLVHGDPGGIGLVRERKLVFEHLWLRDRWEKADLAFPFGEGIAGIAAATDEAITVNDARCDPRVTRPDALDKYGVTGFIDVPIHDRAGKVLGVLDVRRRPGGPAFADADRQLLESLARQAGIAIENAALYSALEEKKRKIAESLWAIQELYGHEQQVTRRLQELDLLKTNFMIVTSHEMRTPLTLLRGYVEALLGGYAGHPSEAQVQALGCCQHAVDRMISSFDDILEMLRLGRQEIALDRRPMDLGTAVEEVIEDLRPFLEQRGQRASLEAPAEVPSLVADAGKIRLVLANLLENAIKFTPDGGEIRVRIHVDPGSLRLAVEDTGIGIDTGELERIFEDFYTSPDTRHHHSGRYEFEARGSGLGLSIAKGYVEAHGGRIWAESEGRGKGARFQLVLPLAAPEAAPPPDEPARLTPARGPAGSPR